MQEKDPNTLFPLQAALGYTIAQNLFIGETNLLVERVSDMIFLLTMSGVLEQGGKTTIGNDVIVKGRKSCYIYFSYK